MPTDPLRAIGDEIRADPERLLGALDIVDEAGRTYLALVARPGYEAAVERGRQPDATADERAFTATADKLLATTFNMLACGLFLGSEREWAKAILGGREPD